MAHTSLFTVRVLQVGPVSDSVDKKPFIVMEITPHNLEI